MNEKKSSQLWILFIGPLAKGSTTRQRMLCFKQLGHHVTDVDTSSLPLPEILSLLSRISCRLGFYWDLSDANRLILENILNYSFDVVWIEKGLTITPDTLKQIKSAQPSAHLVSYCIDDMLLCANQSRNYLHGIPFYDMHLTTKTYNVAELKALDARDVQFFANAFDAIAYHPIELSKEEQAHWGSDVAFLGGYEKPRYEMMLALASRGVVITIWGPGWERFVKIHPNLIIKPGWVQAEDAAKVFCATTINLHFLRKVARDLQTTRSVEIPACGGFMLAERTTEHLELFKEGEEAEFFDSQEELLDKCQYYLRHESQRLRIASNGLRRCIESGYSNEKRLEQILTVALDVRFGS